MPIVEGFDWKPVYEDRKKWLDRNFEVEVKNAVFEMDKDKALGPNGFLPVLLWYSEGDLMVVFHQLFLNGIVGRSMNSTFITLIPKIDDHFVKVKGFTAVSCGIGYFPLMGSCSIALWYSEGLEGTFILECQLFFMFGSIGRCIIVFIYLSSSFNNIFFYIK